MKKIAKIYLLSFLVMTSFSGFSNPTVDSLKTLLSKTFDSKKRVEILNEIAGEYRRSDPQKGIDYARQALSLSKQINYTNGQVNSLIIIGIINKNLGELREAIKNNLEALRLSEMVRNDTLISLCYNNLGNIYQIQEKYLKAIDLYKKSLNIEIKLDIKEQISIRYYNIGANYESLDSFDLALEYYKYSLMLEKDLKNSEGIFYALYGIAGIETQRGNLDVSEKSIRDALHLAYQTSDDVGKMLCYNELGNIYLKRKEFLKAINYFENSLFYSSELNFRTEIITAMSSISEAYKEAGMYREALDYLQQSNKIKDSLINIEDNDKIAELEARYESEKKEQKIREQDIIIEKEQADNDAKDAQQLILIIVIAFLGIVAFMIYRNNRNKNKANKLLKAKNRQILYSLTYAKKIQDAIIPSEDRIRKTFKNSFILFNPRDLVSGDFYWITCIEKRIIFAVADCTGHGVPGAFMSMIGNTLLNEIVSKQRIVEPAEILEHLNKGIILALNQKTSKNDSQDDGMDITVCSFDHGMKEMKIALANHHALLIRDGQVIEIEGDIFAIGGTFSIRDDIKYSQQNVELRPNDRLFLYTDGYKDQTGGQKNELYGMKRFKKLLLDTSDHEPLIQKEALHNEFTRWKGKGKQIDDVLIVGIGV